MKKVVFIALICVASFFIAFFPLKSSFSACQLLNEIETLTNGESSGYTKTCPGPQGNRQSQAVRCHLPTGGDHVVIGCCWGYENCDEISPCNGSPFSCDAKKCYPDA